MIFAELAEALDEINRSSLVGKRALAEDLLSAIPKQDRPRVAAILAGEKISGERLPRDTVIRAISRASGYSKAEVVEILRKSAGLPAVAQGLLGRKRQLSFPDYAPTVHEVLLELETITEPDTGGRSALLRLAKLLSTCEPSSARFVVATCLGESPRYLADSVLLDLLAEREGRDLDRLRIRIEGVGWKRGLD